MIFTLQFPRKVLFGAGTFAQIGAVCRGAAQPPPAVRDLLAAQPAPAAPQGSSALSALLVAGRSALQKSGRLRQAQELLQKAGMSVRLFEGVENDPSLETCARGIAAAREGGCDLVIGIGGGSTLDAGKIIAALAPQTFSVQEFFDGTRDIERPALPFVAVPTTAGTGSEATRVAVLTNTIAQVKKGVRHDSMMPLAAIVDPELTLSAPPALTAQTGMDALTQAIECYVCNAANPATDALALRAMELLAAHLPGAVADGANLEHREPVALGSLLGAIAFANAGLGAVHGLAHPIGAICRDPHGLICAVLLPHVCEFNLPAAPARFDDIARVLGVARGADAPAAILALNRRLGLPATLRDRGLTPALFPRIIAQSRSGSMARNPRPATDQDLADILHRVA